MTPPGSPTPAPDDEWQRVLSLILTLVRAMMRGRDRHQRESMDVAQSLMVDLIPKRDWLLQLPPDELRRVLPVVVRNKLHAFARHDQAVKRRAEFETFDSVDISMPEQRRDASGSSVMRRHDALREALDALSPQSHAAVMMYLGGASHAEIATALGTTDQAARQRTSRAIRDVVIVARREAGQGWDAIALALDMSAEEVERRHAALRAVNP